MSTARSTPTTSATPSSASSRRRASSCRAATPAPTRSTSCARRRRCGSSGVPVLGICYGMFTMAVQLGGEVEASDHREFGYAEVRAHGHTRLLEGIEDFSTAEGHGMLKVWMSHGDKVTALPPGFKLMACTPSCPIAGMADEARRYYGVQFHPEVTHTVQGRGDARALRARDLRRARPDWVMRDYVAEAVARDPRAGRQRRGDPRPVGRRRFERRRGADPPRDRRPADLRLRRPRPAAPERSGDGDGDVRRPAAREGRARRRRRPSSSASSPA